MPKGLEGVEREHGQRTRERHPIHKVVQKFEGKLRQLVL